MALHRFFLLLLVAKSMALWVINSGIRSSHSPASIRGVPTQCTQAGIFCSNCQESYFCQTPTSTPVIIACDPGFVCAGTPGFAACLNSVGTSAGDCDCDTVGNVGFLADPYDSTKYFICIAPEGQFLITCGDGLVFSAEENSCVEASGTGTDVIQVDSNVPCTVNPVGFYTNDPTCQTYTVCISNSLPGILATCSNGLAFDSSMPGCVNQCLLGPTPFACQPGVSDSLGDSGAFPDSSDCTIFHVCSNGALISSASCPGSLLFNPTTMACVAASTGVVCPVINPCWAAYCDACPGTCPTDSSSGTNTTNPTIDPNGSNSSPDTIVTTPAGGGSGIPSCNTNTTGYFEYASDCKKFWSCQDDDAGGHEAILYRCPGALVFIPSTRYCSLESDLPAAPGCITS